MKSKGKKIDHLSKRKITIFVMMLLLVTALTSSAFFGESKDDKTVVTINNIVLPVNHFKSELQRNVPDVFTYFQIHHNIVASEKEKFWEEFYGGENPAEVARQTVLKNWIENIVVLELAKEKGLIEDITYNGLVKKWRDENALSKKKLEKGEIVFGPYEYTFQGFIGTNIATFRSNLVTMFSLNEFKLSDEELRRLYENEKEEKHVYNDDITINQIRISYYEKDLNLISESMKTAEEKIKQAKDRIDAGENFETVANDFNTEGSQMELRYKPENSYDDYRTDTIIRRNALQLERGEVSDIIQDDEGEFFAIIQCVERTHGGFMPFDERKETIQLTYAVYMLDQMIQQRTQDAEIIIDNKVYSNILP
jgi:hypothetical protein